jgi:hypothetical protein
MSASNAEAQEDTSRAVRSSVESDSTLRTAADEEFDLNIAERRIDAGHFYAATELAVGSEEGLSLEVGVGVMAEQIVGLLRNVRGHVRFQGSLDPIIECIRRHRTPDQSGR